MKFPAAIHIAANKIIAADNAMMAAGFDRKSRDELKRVFDEVDKAAGPGVQVGRIVSFPYADGHAHYMIGTVGKRICKLFHLPIGDQWHSPVVTSNGSCPYSTVADAINRKDLMMQTFGKMETEDDRFYNNLALGSKIHYHNGFGQFVRYEVVMGKYKDRDEKNHVGKCLKPIAMVGNWATSDLYQVHKTGVVYYPYHAKKVKDGELCRMSPSAGTLYEATPSATRNNIDPRTLAPLAIDPPPFSEMEKIRHADWSTVVKVAAILAKPDEAPTDLLREAQEVITNYLARGK